MILVILQSDHDYEEFWINDDNAQAVRNLLNSLPEPVEA